MDDDNVKPDPMDEDLGKPATGSDGLDPLDEEEEELGDGELPDEDDDLLEREE